MTRPAIAEGASVDAAPTPDAPALRVGDVHVWQASVEDMMTLTAALEDVLDHREEARAVSFRRPADRQRYIGAHGVLRLLLGAYLRRDPAQVGIRVSSSGKPALAGSARLTGLVFNLSHDDDVVLIGLSRFAHVGVDVQSHVTSSRVDLLYEQALTKGERAWLADRGGRGAVEEVMRLWTRKEAVVKADGTGMRRRLTELDVSGPSPLVVPHPGGRLGPPLLVRDLDVGAHFSAAVAASPWCRRLEQRTWPVR